MPDPLTGSAAARKIDGLLDDLGDDWRGSQLAKVRRLFHRALPQVEEQWKWMGSPVWSYGGILAVGNAHKQKVKLTFPHGAELDDPDGLFNAGFNGKVWRAIDLYEGDTLPARAFQSLVRRAAAYYETRDGASSSAAV